VLTCDDMHSVTIKLIQCELQPYAGCRCISLKPDLYAAVAVELVISYSPFRTSKRLEKQWLWWLYWECILLSFAKSFLVIVFLTYVCNKWQVMAQWQAFVNTVMILQVPWKNFSNSWVTISFSRRTLLYGVNTWLVYSFLVRCFDIITLFNDVCL